MALDPMRNPLHAPQPHPLPLPDHHASRPLSDRERYAVAIWAWTKAHPHSSFEEFMRAIERAERLASRNPA